MMALLLGAIEAPYEACSQLARASEVSWKWSVFSLLLVFLASLADPVHLSSTGRDVTAHPDHVLRAHVIRDLNPNTTPDTKLKQPIFSHIHSSYTRDTERYCEPELILSMSESTRMLAVAEMKHPSLVIEALCFVSTPMYFNPFASAARPMGPLLSIGHCVRSLCTRLNLFLISCPLSIIS